MLTSSYLLFIRDDAFVANREQVSCKTGILRTFAAVTVFLVSPLSLYNPNSYRVVTLFLNFFLT